MLTLPRVQNSTRHGLISNVVCPYVRLTKYAVNMVTLALNTSTSAMYIVTSWKIKSVYLLQILRICVWINLANFIVYCDPSSATQLSMLLNCMNIILGYLPYLGNVLHKSLLAVPRLRLQSLFLLMRCCMASSCLNATRPMAVTG